MKNNPVLDSTSREDLRKLFGKRAEQYTPNWRYDPAVMDGGGALAELFVQMHYETIDRFNLLPIKHYEEFLNMLGVKDKNANSATGYIQFEVSDALDEGIAIPQNTAVIAKSGDSNIIFETESAIQSTPAKLLDVYYANSEKGIIELVDHTKACSFFETNGGTNLQNHEFGLCENDVLNLQEPAVIEIEIEQQAHFMQAQTTLTLANDKNTKFYYLCNNVKVEFDKVSCQENVLRLEKHLSGRLMPQSDGNIYIYCQVNSALQDTIKLDSVKMRSQLLQKRVHNVIAAFNYVPIDLSDSGGYCFGRRPSELDAFYMRSDFVFDKRGANVSVELEIVTVKHDDVDENEVMYMYGKSVIDKNDSVKITLDEVYVQEVIFEYYNNIDWTYLKVDEDKNPFNCNSEGTKRFVFTVPSDINKATVNGVEGYFIRARVVNIANYFSQKGRWLLPFVKWVSATYAYQISPSVTALFCENNAEYVEINNAKQIDHLAFTAYVPQEYTPPTMYLRFDKSPHAMPLSILFKVCKSGKTGEISFEGFTGKRFEFLRVIDKTNCFMYTGTVKLYIFEPLIKHTLFGKTGYFIKVSTNKTKEMHCPLIDGILVNVCRAHQMQAAEDQFFSTEVYEANKQIKLLYTPVATLEVWVDEKKRLDNAAAVLLEKEQPHNVEIVREGSEIISCFIRYEVLSSLRKAGAHDRCCAIDAFEGIITFGDGKHGYVPPEGNDNIRVKYSFGGGKYGNMPLGSITSLLRAIPFVIGVRNVTPMSGGTDRMDFERQKELANKFLRHRNRAVTAQEFEQLTLERFGQVRHVKCFGNTDQNGNEAIGHVCLALVSEFDQSEVAGKDLSDRVYDFLKSKCDITLSAMGWLHVVLATEYTINVSIVVSVKNPDLATTTHELILKAINNTILSLWSAKPIGEQIDVVTLMQKIRQVPNVLAVLEMLVEGVSLIEGVAVHVPIDENSVMPFATVCSGKHTIFMR